MEIKVTNKLPYLIMCTFPLLFKKIKHSSSLSVKYLFHYGFTLTNSNYQIKSKQERAQERLEMTLRLWKILDIASGGMQKFTYQYHKH